MKIRAALLTLLFLCTCFLTASAADTATLGKIPKHNIKPGTLSGTLSDSAGKKLVGKKVEIVNAEGKVLGSAVSDKNGMYRIRNLPEGDYTMKVDNEPIAALTGTKVATVSTLTVVIPAAGAAAALVPLQWTLIGVGGAAVIVGVPAAIHHNRSKHHRPAPSPISP